MEAAIKRTVEAGLRGGALLAASIGAVTALSVLGCTLVRPDEVTVALRDPPGLVARCTGTPLPGPDECREHGEQATAERTRVDVGIATIHVTFGPADGNGCREVDYAVFYVDGTAEQIRTHACRIE